MDVVHETVHAVKSEAAIYANIAIHVHALKFFSFQISDQSVAVFYEPRVVLWVTEVAMEEHLFISSIRDLLV